MSPAAREARNWHVTRNYIDHSGAAVAVCSRDRAQPIEPPLDQESIGGKRRPGVE